MLCCCGSAHEDSFRMAIFWSNNLLPLGTRGVYLQIAQYMCQSLCCHIAAIVSNSSCDYVWWLWQIQKHSEHKAEAIHVKFRTLWKDTSPPATLANCNGRGDICCSSCKCCMTLKDGTIGPVARHTTSLGSSGLPLRKCLLGFNTSYTCRHSIFASSLYE